MNLSRFRKLRSLYGKTITFYRRNIKVDNSPEQVIVQNVESVIIERRIPEDILFTGNVTGSEYFYGYINVPDGIEIRKGDYVRIKDEQQNLQIRNIVAGGRKMLELDLETGDI